MKANYAMTNAKRGAVIAPTGKTRITIYFSDKVLAGFQRSKVNCKHRQQRAIYYMPSVT